MTSLTRFVHIGDVHLQHGHPRHADRLASLDRIVAEGLQLEGLAAWLVPGDLFHARSTVDDRNALAERLLRMAHAAPIVLVRGNHDQPGDLDIFARLKAEWPVYLATRPGVLAVPLATGETAAIACLPYPDRFGLVAAGVAPGDVVPTASDLLDVIFMQLAHGLSVARVSGAIPLFLGHVNVRGAIASTGQPQIGVEIEIDRAMLARLPVVYCALNHIHKPQEVGAGVFAGSIAAMDHGETEPKSYVVVETTRLPSGSWMGTWTRQPLATPPMFHVDGELTRDGFFLAQDAPLCGDCGGTGNDSYSGTELPSFCDACGGDGRRKDWTGCDVRVRYTFKASEKAVLDDSVVRALFASALRLKIEPVAVPDRALRSQAVADAHSLADKLVAYALDAGVEASARVLTKLARLEHTDPVQLQADVQRALMIVETSEADKQTEVAAEATFDEPTATAQPVLWVAS